MAHYPQCRKCCYDLTGLAERGQCPECGQFFSHATGEGVRPPETPYQRGDRLLARLRTIAAAGLGVVLILGGITLSVLGVDHAATIGGLFGAIAILGAYTSYVYEEPDR